MGRDAPAGVTRKGTFSPEDIDRILAYQNYVRNRMAELVEAIGRVAAGDFSAKPEIGDEDDDELAQFVVGFRFMLEDLEHAQAEQRMKAHELEAAYDRLRFQATLLQRQSEASPDGILVVSPEGKILSYNRRFLEMWGLPPEVTGTGSDDAALEFVQNQLENPDAFLERVRYLYEHPDQESHDELRLADGRFFDRRSAPVQDVDGRRYGRVWYFRDVTAAKESERELREAYERLKELSTMKTNFINMVAHELATPLTPLKLQLAVLQSSGDESLTERQSRAITILDRNVERLANLVGDVLDVARLEADRLPLRLETMDLADAVEDGVQTFGEAASAAGVRLGFHGGGPLPVEADPARVAQVLNNLLSNAIKFTPRGGSVRVECQAEGDQAVVRVRDTGIGLADEDFARLFQPFSQVHDPMERTRSGTGLGLFITHGIVERHGGTISCDSPGRGRGTTFTVRLPLGRTGQASPGEQAASKPGRSAVSRCPRCGSRDLVVRLIKDRTRCNACGHDWS